MRCEIRVPENLGGEVQCRLEQGHENDSAHEALIDGERQLWIFARQEYVAQYVEDDWPEPEQEASSR